MDSAYLAYKLRERGYYVSRHANWLLVMKDERIVATIYLYPDYKEATVVDRDEVYSLVSEILNDYKVNRKRPSVLD